MAFAPDGSLWITEKAGNVYRIADLETGERQLVLSVPGHATIERGLLGLAFLDNWLYLHYVRADGDARIVRFDVSDPAAPGEEELIFDIGTTGFNHVGGALAFGPDGKLYIGSGEGKRRARELPSRVAQSTVTFKGKILRINPDGSVPADNPWHNAVWAIGFRNPYTFAFGPDGQLYVNDVGEKQWEEINDVRAGGNYGWPDCEGPCGEDGFEDPIYAYAHDEGIAITGAAFWAGAYFFGDFASDWVRRLDGNDATLALDEADAPVDLDVGPDGRLYYLSLYGRVYRVGWGDE
jgi:glucose/arabinose dehydrogenase